MPRAIRILHVVDTLGKGGLENGLVNLIQGLDPGRFEHVVCAIRQLGANADRLPLERVRVRCLGKRGWRARVQMPALARVIREESPDIVHSRNWSAIEAVVAGWWVRSCAVVHSEHGLESEAGAREPRRRIWFRRLAFELADRVLSVSCQLRDLHARRTGFPAERITVMHNGVDSRRFFPDGAARARVRQQLGLAADQFCIGCVGNLFPVKDHLTLLQAVAALDGTVRNWRLLIIGEGPERAKLQAFAQARPGWDRQVAFLGSSNCVPELLNALDAYVLPSLAEGVSNSLLEAMATGLPVVATAVGGNPEVVVDGQSGLLFPAGDSARLAEHLRRLHDGPELRRELGGEALRRVREEFSLRAMIRRYEELYMSMAAEAAPLHAVAGA